MKPRILHLQPCLRIGVTAVALSMSALPSISSALTVTHVSDSTLAQLIGGDAPFAASGRIGDVAEAPAALATPGGGNFELGLGFTMDEPSTTRDFAWSNGVDQTFSLAYDASAKKFTYTVGDTTLKYRGSQDFPFTDLVLRANASDTNESFVSNVQVNGQAIGSVFSGGGGADVLRIAGIDMTQNLTVTGNASLTWAGVPANNALGFNLALVQAVPEPSQFMMLAVGTVLLGGLAYWRKDGN